MSQSVYNYKKTVQSPTRAMIHHNRVYLAGGLRTNWQEKVIQNCQRANFIFFNPRNHQNEHNSKLYTAWDFHFVQQSDIVFAYMEATNPSGYGLCVEIGFAKAHGKTIILVDERSKEDEKFEKYFKFVQNASDAVFDNLEAGIEFLKSFTNIEYTSPH